MRFASLREPVCDGPEQWSALHLSAPHDAQALPTNRLPFLPKYSTAKSHIPVISRWLEKTKEMTQETGEKKRGAQHDASRATAGVVCKATEKRTRTSGTAVGPKRFWETDPHLRHKGKKEREKKQEPPAPRARESGHSSPATLFPSRQWGPLVRLSDFCSFQNFPFYFIFRAGVKWIGVSKNQRCFQILFTIRSFTTFPPLLFLPGEMAKRSAPHVKKKPIKPSLIFLPHSSNNHEIMHPPLENRNQQQSVLYIF
jgi:hypothetical protein